ncbi:hypothetical protein GYMLUDRAFT_239139 [Collybiopsis luxurians FD-317 M1]|nr:hypothetical protein GYMLUDRAFT_239139 [Collybiopsis luxurians FD-317 M1]
MLRSDIRKNVNMAQRGDFEKKNVVKAVSNRMARAMQEAPTNIPAAVKIPFPEHFRSLLAGRTGYNDAHSMYQQCLQFFHQRAVTAGNTELVTLQVTMSYPQAGKFKPVGDVTAAIQHVNMRKFALDEYAANADNGSVVLETIKIGVGCKCVEFSLSAKNKPPDFPVSKGAKSCFESVPSSSSPSSSSGSGLESEFISGGVYLRPQPPSSSSIDSSPSPPKDTVKEAKGCLAFDKVSKLEVMNYPNGPRTLSGERAPYLVIPASSPSTATDNTGEGDCDFLKCNALYCIGAPTSFHATCSLLVIPIKK